MLDDVSVPAVNKFFDQKHENIFVRKYVL